MAWRRLKTKEVERHTAVIQADIETLQIQLAHVEAENYHEALFRYAPWIQPQDLANPDFPAPWGAAAAAAAVAAGLAAAALAEGQQESGPSPRPSG
jgi:hypothetical protein